MKSVPICLALAILIALLGCRRAEEPPADVASDDTGETSESELSEGDYGGYEFEAEGDNSDSAANNLPKLTLISITTLETGNLRGGFEAIPQATDAEGDELSFRYQWSKNGSLIVGATDSVLDWGEDFKKGDKISVEVTVSDGQNAGAWRAEGEFRIPNSPPKIVSEPTARIEDGKFAYGIKAEDPDGDAIEYSIRNAPKGMTIEPATGRMAWDFSEKDIGEYSVEAIATDSDGAKTSQILSLSIPENP